MSQEEFDDFVSKWEKAQKEGIFPSAPKLPSTSTPTGKSSFFGPIDTNPTDSINQSDSDYWKAIYATGDGVDFGPINESDSKEVIENPIRRDSEGKDQDMAPYQLGATFSEEDIKSLEEMKVKLHELQSKVATLEDEDKNKYDPQIKSLLSKIDELSDKLSHTKK